MALDRDQLKAFAQSSKKAFEEHLRMLVEIPSVSADPSHKGQLLRCAEAASALLNAYGAESKVLPTDGAPLVTGFFKSDPSHPTITVYNHLDVQPANEPEWKSDPFKLLIENDVYRGRGTTDDKGPALTALLGAVAAVNNDVPINIRFLWELEEEIGSPSFRSALERYKDQLATDSIVVSDTIWLTRGKPSTPAGLRGLQGFSLHLSTADHDLHSGLVGGAARNPIAELIALIAQMFDGRTGEIKIPGFYADVVDLTVAEALDFARSGFTIETFKKDHHLRGLRTEDPLEVMTKVWAAPTMEVHGIVGGYIGPGIKSAVPARAEAKMSCRMVPNQRGAKVMELITNFVKTHAPDVEIIAESCLEPYRGSSTGPYADALRDAYAFGFGTKPAFTREGASIGAVPTMEQILAAPVLFLGLSLPEHGYHAPNENYDWEQASGGIAAFARYFESVASLDPRVS